MIIACTSGLYQQMETVALLILHTLSICAHRELLVIGGVAAKDQLSALEQGVRELNGIYNSKCLEITGKLNSVSVHPAPFLGGLFKTRLISLWELLADWMISYLLVNSVCPKSAF